MANVSRLGDSTDHGGVVITASSTVFVDGIGVCRETDLHNCPIPGHGINPFTSSSTRKANGLRIVRTGIDPSVCGGKVVAGSPDVHITS